MDVKEIFRQANLIPRKGQAEAAESIKKALETGIDTLFVAPTGWGKTLAVLAALKAAGRLPALWLVRSLKLGDRISKDALLIGLRPFVAAGRKKTCPLAYRYGDAIHVWCRLFRVNCEFYVELLKRGVDASGVLSWEELLDKGICPYYGQDFVAREADVIIQNYHRRSYPVSACIVDETHNLLAPRVRRLKIDTLINAATEISAVGYHELGEEVRRYASRTGYIPLEKLPLAELERSLVDAVQVLKKVKALPKLVSAVRAAQRGAAYREPWSDVVEIYEAPWRPRVKPTVFITATLPREMEPLLGVEGVVRVEPEPRTAFVTSWLTSKWGQETWWEYQKFLFKLKMRFKKVLVFATERIALRVLEKVDYYEPEFESGIPEDWRGVLLLHSRGRFAEGVDIRCDCVVVLGCPFLPPEVAARLKRFYRKMGIPGNAALWSPMVITTLQCVGRATRSPEDRPIIILADNRFLKYEEFFHPYITLQEVKDENDLFRQTLPSPA